MPRSTRNKTASGCGDASGELLDHYLIYLISFDANRFLKSLSFITEITYTSSNFIHTEFKNSG